MIAFRVDANERVATGHLMRCIAIAVQLQKRGEECCFYLAEENYVDRLKEHALPYRILNSEWNKMEDELPTLRKLLKKDQPSWLIVDSYQATCGYLQAVQQQVKVLYLDDLGMERYPVSAVLHYSDWQENEEYRSRYFGTGTMVLNGMRYVPLRDEFYPGEKERAKRILITTGGTDPYHIAERLMAAIPASFELSGYAFDIVVGAFHQNREELERLAKGKDSFYLHSGIRNMGDIMRTCRYAVSAGGTTLYELCACRVPGVCFSFAQNQEEFARKMGEKGIFIYAGDARRGAQEVVGRIVNGLGKLVQKEAEMAERMGMLVDGRGTARIADFLLGSKGK